MNKNIISVLVIAFIFFFAANVYATDDLVWAIPKLDNLRNAQGLSAKAELRPLPKSLSDSKSYIVGGSPTPLGKYPEYALLWEDGLDGYWYAICGASLIATNKILTAAHCTVDSSASRLAVIPNFHSFSEDATLGNLIYVGQKIEHPNYNESPSTRNDIAVLTLNEQVSTAKANIYGGTKQLAGHTATVIGTGRLSGDGDAPNTLQEVDLTIVGNSQCAGVWGSSAITSAMMCAGGTSSGGIGACSGDSGGPLFVSLYGKRVQAGIVSWGHKDCAVPNYYDVYARTSSLIGFVKQNAQAASIIYDPVGSTVGFFPSIYLLLFDSDQIVLNQSDSVTQNNWKYYIVNAPASYTKIKAELYNLSQDADLYVRDGANPNTNAYDCRPYFGGTSNETCELTYSGATEWHIGVHGYSSGTTTYTIKATLY